MEQKMLLLTKQLKGVREIIVSRKEKEKILEWLQRNGLNIRKIP